jgi:hypothetical protein
MKGSWIAIPLRHALFRPQCNRLNTHGGLSPQSTHSRQLLSFPQKQQFGRAPSNASEIALSMATLLFCIILSISFWRRSAC